MAFRDFFCVYVKNIADYIFLSYFCVLYIEHKTYFFVLHIEHEKLKDVKKNFIYAKRFRYLFTFARKNFRET